MQVQTLVDSLNAEARPPGRARFLSCSRLPPSWQLEAELCRLHQSLGSHKSALDIALRLKQWEVVIECYHLLQVSVTTVFAFDWACIEPVRSVELYRPT